MGILNKILGAVSGISGLGMFTASLQSHDIGTGFSGIGAVTMAVILFQLTDLRDRVKTIEACLLNHSNGKGKSAGR